MQVYVSGEGRTFGRRNIGRAAREGVGGRAITKGAGGSRFQDNSLVIAGTTRGGGARVELSIFRVFPTIKDSVIDR